MRNRPNVLPFLLQTAGLTGVEGLPRARPRPATPAQEAPHARLSTAEHGPDAPAPLQSTTQSPPPVQARDLDDARAALRDVRPVWLPSGRRFYLGSVE